MNKLKTAITKLGNEIYLTGDESAKVLVIGVFHGDEPQGKYLIEKYLSEELPHLEIKDFGPPSRGGHKYNKKLLTTAKMLRTHLTKPEVILWQHLKQKQLGFKFRRQQPIGKYIVDFVCFEKKLIIELDGGKHNEPTNIANDIKRDNFLRQAGFKVLRIWNNYIYENIDTVVNYIRDVLATCPPLEGGPEFSIPRRGQQQKKAGKLFIPCLNPDGLQLGQRTNANGVDINRNFPTQNWELTEKNEFFGGEKPASEIETQFVINVINEYQPQTILTLHAPFKVVNYDGPAEQLAEQISQIINYPVEASIGYPTPGSFGTYAGIERQIKTITLELDEECPQEALVEPVFEIFDSLL